MTALQRRTEPNSVEEIINRTDSYFTYNSNGHALVDTITNASNKLHKTSLKGPGNILIVSEDDVNFIMTDQLFRSGELFIASSLIVGFKDAKYEGMYNNRQFVFSTQTLRKGNMIIGLESNGTEFVYSNKKTDSDIPIIDVEISKKWKIGDIQYFGFIKFEE